MSLNMENVNATIFTCVIIYLLLHGIWRQPGPNSFRGLLNRVIEVLVSLGSASQQLKLSQKRRQLNACTDDDWTMCLPTIWWEVNQPGKMEDFPWTDICPSKYLLSRTLCMWAHVGRRAGWLYPDL